MLRLEQGVRAWHSRVSRWSARHRRSGDGAYAAKLTSPALSARERRAHTIAWGPAPLVVAARTAVAFASPSVAVAGYVATVLVYVLPVPRLVALGQRRRRAPSGHRGEVGR